MMFAGLFLAFLFAFAITGGMLHVRARRLQDENDAIDAWNNGIGYTRKHPVANLSGKGKTKA